MSVLPDTVFRPARKRLRKDSGASSHQPESLAFTRDIKYWYRDGNVVIVAGGIGFRIFKSLLAEDSTVFRDMFSLPTPPSDAQHVDELDGATPYSIVHVSDTVDEFRSFLSLLLHGHRYMHRGILFDDLANSVRLTHKYNVDGVLQDLLHMLHHIYPHEFKPWEEDVPAANADAIVAVNLARLTNTPCILPSAFYLCSQLDIDILWAGRIRRDGVVDTLSTEDLKRCVAGKVKLAMHNVQNIEKIFAPVANVHCATSTRCKSSRKQLRSYCIADALLLEYDPGALASWKDAINSARDPDHALCSSCISKCIERAQSARAQLWEKLPELMDLNKE